MKAILNVTNGSVRLWTQAGVAAVLDETTQLIEPTSWDKSILVSEDAGPIDLPDVWGVGSASSLASPAHCDGEFEVKFEEAGEVEQYLECKDEFGTVVPCGQIGQPGSITHKVLGGASWGGRVHESNALTLASFR